MPDAAKVIPLDPDEEAYLRALGTVMALLPRVVDADMLGALRISGTEYTVLVHLSEVPHRQLRMSELANACGLSLSGMTRVVNRLESQSLVSRQKCPEDGRAWLVLLTGPGRRMMEQAWPTKSRQRAPSHLLPTGRVRRGGGSGGAAAHRGTLTYGSRAVCALGASRPSAPTGRFPHRPMSRARQENWVQDLSGL